MRALPLALALVCLGASPATEIVGSGERGPSPRFDPFDRPALPEDVTARRPSSASASWSPWLKATLMAGESSFANLGGVVLKLGEETHGYRLLEVREWTAVFSVDGERVVLAVVPPFEPER